MARSPRSSIAFAASLPDQIHTRSPDHALDDQAHQQPCGMRRRLAARQSNGVEFAAARFSVCAGSRERIRRPRGSYRNLLRRSRAEGDGALWTDEPLLLANIAAAECADRTLGL